MNDTDFAGLDPALDPLGLYRSLAKHTEGGARREADSPAARGMQIVEGGVPRFLRGRPAPPPAELVDLLAATRREGFRKAIDQFSNPIAHRYVTRQDRARFLDLLPLGPDAVALEVGASLGQITVAIAPRVRAVYALEVVPEQAEVAKLRCEGEGLNNVVVACGGDDCTLPYADQAFDVVVLNLVLEWCAGRNPDEPAVVGQRRMLAECARVLRPGGALWVATKNRYALRYLLGRPDEHAHGLPFGNALPRPLLSALLRARGHDRPLGVLHSHDALAAMLREAGFDRLTSYWATPEMRFPTHFVPTDPARVREARRDPELPQGDRRSTRLLTSLLPAPLVRHVTPGLAFLAFTEGAPTSGAPRAARS